VAGRVAGSHLIWRGVGSARILVGTVVAAIWSPRLPGAPAGRGARRAAEPGGSHL